MQAAFDYSDELGIELAILMSRHGLEEFTPTMAVVELYWMLQEKVSDHQLCNLAAKSQGLERRLALLEHLGRAVRHSFAKLLGPRLLLSDYVGRERNGGAAFACIAPGSGSQSVDGLMPDIARLRRLANTALQQACSARDPSFLKLVSGFRMAVETHPVAAESGYNLVDSVHRSLIEAVESDRSGHRCLSPFLEELARFKDLPELAVAMLVGAFAFFMIEFDYQGDGCCYPTPGRDAPDEVELALPTMRCAQNLEQLLSEGCLFLAQLHESTGSVDPYAESDAAAFRNWVCTQHSRGADALIAAGSAIETLAVAMHPLIKMSLRQ